MALVHDATRYAHAPLPCVSMIRTQGDSLVTSSRLRVVHTDVRKSRPLHHDLHASLASVALRCSQPSLLRSSALLLVTGTAVPAIPAVAILLASAVSLRVQLEDATSALVCCRARRHVHTRGCSTYSAMPEKPLDLGSHQLNELLHQEKGNKTGDAAASDFRMPRHCRGMGSTE